MSLSISTIAVLDSPREEVVTALKEYLLEKGGSLEEIPSEQIENNPSNLKIFSKNNHTYLVSPSSGLIPKMLLALSFKLKKKIVAIDEEEAVGYQHFSIINNGVAQAVFSYFDGVKDNLNVNVQQIISEAVSRGKIILKPGDQNDMPELVFAAFVTTNETGENLETLTMESLRDPTLSSYRIIGYKPPVIGSRGPEDFWEKQTSE